MTAPTVSLTELGKLPLPGIDKFAPCYRLEFEKYGDASGDVELRLVRRRKTREDIAIACRAAERWWMDYAEALWRKRHTVYVSDVAAQWGHFAALLERGAEIVP